jgi:hypothetical protein
MTRARIIRYQGASYYEHVGKLNADGAVIFGPHLDPDPDKPERLADVFAPARKFAHAMAQEMGEPFAWGWFQTPEGARPAVCAVELVPKWTFTVNGRTDRP